MGVETQRGVDIGPPFAAPVRKRTGWELAVNDAPRDQPPASDVDGRRAEGTAPGDSPDGDFVQMLTRYQRRLFLHILAQVPYPVDADEILQETSIIAWDKFQQFRPGTNFLAWVSQIATFEIMKYRSRRRRERLQFSEEFLEAVAQESIAQEDTLEARRAALVHCIQKLRERDRQLIQQRYSPGESGKGLAETVGRPANSVYQSLGRIRRTLLECINRRMAASS